MSKSISIGVLGSSSFACRTILPTLVMLPDQFSLVGIASRDLAKARKIADRFNSIAFEEYEKLINSSGLTALYIPLPNALHHHWVKRALLAGLHVLVEKPLACTAHEAKELIKIAAHRKLVLLENFQFRFHAQLSVIKRLVDKGVIGELRCIRSSFGFPPFSDKKNIRYSKNLGGGALLDAGAYPIKISQIFLGDKLRVNGARLYYDSIKNIDIWGGGLISQIRGPLFSEIAFGFDNHYQCRLELWGNKGALTTNRIFTAPPDYAPEVLLETVGKKQCISVPPDNHFVNLLKHFYKLISTGEGIAEEYNQNLTQANLIEEFRNVAHAQQ